MKIIIKRAAAMVGIVVLVILGLVDAFLILANSVGTRYR